LEVGGAFDQ